jgi:hypothetical protein
VVDDEPEEAEALFDLAERTLLAYDDCTTALEEGDEARRRQAGDMDFSEDEDDMQVSSALVSASLEGVKPWVMSESVLCDQVDGGVEEHKGPALHNMRRVTRAGRRAQHFLNVRLRPVRI